MQYSYNNYLKKIDSCVYVQLINILLWLNLNLFFQINLAPAFEKIRESARAISESVPPEIRQAVDEVVEGNVRIITIADNFHTNLHSH